MKNAVKTRKVRRQNILPLIHKVAERMANVHPENMDEIRKRNKGFTHFDPYWHMKEKIIVFASRVQN